MPAILLGVAFKVPLELLYIPSTAKCGIQGSNWSCFLSPLLLGVAFKVPLERLYIPSTARCGIQGPIGTAFCPLYYQVWHSRSFQSDYGKGLQLDWECCHVPALNLPFWPSFISMWLYIFILTHFVNIVWFLSALIPTHIDLTPHCTQFYPTFSSILIFRDIFLLSAALFWSRSVKLLGINIDNMLEFTQNVSNIIWKCGFQLNTLRHQSKLLNTKTKLMILYSFIQANLYYCPLILINRNRTDMKRIENVQKHALRIVDNDRTVDYSELLNRAKICTIETGWKRQLVTEVYKAMNNLTPSYISDMFKEKNLIYNLRSSQIITQPKFNSQTHGYHSLRNEGTHLWATLPNSCKETKEINTFKQMIVD